MAKRGRKKQTPKFKLGDKVRSTGEIGIWDFLKRHLMRVY